MDDKTKEYLLKKIQEMKAKVRKTKKLSAKNDWKEFRTNINKGVKNDNMA